MDILKEFGLCIKKIRKEKNLSQEQLAEKAKVHRTYIGMIQRGEKNITLINIKKLSNALETSIFELFREL
jgi:transcriptional regulator with XRE-family HTH domain